MFKKSAVEKRLRKISKQEAASVKLLEKQVNANATGEQMVLKSGKSLLKSVFFRNLNSVEL